MTNFNNHGRTRTTQLKVASRLVLMALWLAFQVAEAIAVDDSGPATCLKVQGEFSIRGTRVDAGLPAREVVYLERNLGELLLKVANRFSLRFDSSLKRVEVVVLDLDGKSIYEYHYDPVYVCIDGSLLRESHVTGGSEGCSKSIHSTTRLFVDDRQSLVFETVERAKFGTACLSNDVETRRVTTFPKAPAAAP
jgi:hypothetical protein